METKHTKGEWQARCMGSEGSVVWLKGNLSKENRSLSPIADCTQRPFNESNANAKLIAAAPDTTHCLYKTTEYLKSLLRNDCIKGVGTIQTIKEIVFYNEEQIKKATE